jgi:hypothetical protein
MGIAHSKTISADFATTVYTFTSAGPVLRDGFIACWMPNIITA